MSWPLAFQVFSPLLIAAGILYRCASLYFLRFRQREAIWRLCGAISKLERVPDVEDIPFEVLKVSTLFDFYERALFGPRCPSGLILEWTEMQAIVLELKRMSDVKFNSLEAWRTYLQRILYQLQGLHSKARLVLFTL